MASHPGYFEKDPALTYRILLGRELLRGDPDAARKVMERYGGRKEVESADNLFLAALFHYVQDEPAEAVASGEAAG